MRIYSFFNPLVDRDRSIQDDRHGIRDPSSGIDAMKIYTNTLVKTRIPELFKTVAGINGHAIQLKQELNRIAKIKPSDGLIYDEAICTSKFLKRSIEKSLIEARSARRLAPGYNWQHHYSI